MSDHGHDPSAQNARTTQLILEWLVHLAAAHNARINGCQDLGNYLCQYLHDSGITDQEVVRMFREAQSEIGRSP